MKQEHRERRKNTKERAQHGHRIITLAATIRRPEHSEIPSDVLGSYTGTAKQGSVPEQDADDL